MCAKEIGKEVATLGCLAILLNPVMLVVFVILGFALLIIGMAFIVYYGLVTAITLFLLSAIGLVVLHYFKAINIEKQPFIAALPFLMLAIGYFGEKLSIFSVQPLWTTGQPVGTENSIFVMLVMVLLVLVLAVAMSRKK